jgi:Uma2 family endonuclease
MGSETQGPTSRANTEPSIQTAMAPVELEPYRFTIEEYLKMGEAEIISPEERVELIDGQVVTMSPIGTWDYASVSLLYRALADQIGGAYCISPKGGLNIGRHTQLVPDMVV